MKDNVRRALIFVVTIGAGSLFVFVDLPLILIIPLIAALGIILLILIGSIKIDEITQPLKSAFAKIRPGKGKTPTKPAAKETPKPKPAPGEKSKISQSFAPVIEKLKKFKIPKISLPSKEKTDTKIKEIDKELDSALASGKTRDSGKGIAAGSGTADAGLAATAAKSEETGDEEDPFLSLTGEDFDSDLLDGLEGDDEVGLPVTPSSSSTESVSEPAATAEVPVAPLPDLQEEMGDLEGVDEIDSELSNLDDIDLDSMDLDEDDESPAPAQSSPKPTDEPAIPDTPPPVKEPTKKEANIGFDNAMMQEMVPEQIDIAAMAGPVGSDDDMLSLLAAEAKVSRKKDDDSLLRDLKDFKAPATDIESELQDIMKMIGEKTGKKDDSKTPAVQEGGAGND